MAEHAIVDLTCDDDFVPSRQVATPLVVDLTDTRPVIVAVPGPAAPAIEPSDARPTKEAEQIKKRLIKTLGDGIKNGLRLIPPAYVAEPGTLNQNCSFACFESIFGQENLRPVGYSASTPEITTKVHQKRLVEIFGTTKIEHGGSRDKRYDCEYANISFRPDTGELSLAYHPKHKGPTFGGRTNNRMYL